MSFLSSHHGRQGFYIAEIGMNHNGDLQRARTLIREAADAGADAVKFQSIVPEEIVSPYNDAMLKGDGSLFMDETVLHFFREHSLDADAHRELQQTASDEGVLFVSSPFSLSMVELLEDLDVPFYKIASSEVTTIPLLKGIARTGKPVLLSTGMADEEEIARACGILSDGGCREIILLHCISLYPVRDDEMNLLRVPRLAERFGYATGLSDHSPGAEAAMIAAALGARVFEKHFTSDDGVDCPDKAVSVTPQGFREYIHAAERAIEMCGSGSLHPVEREREVARAARRSLFAARDIRQGEVIHSEDLTFLRPGTGISVADIDQVKGRRALMNIAAGDPLDFSMLEE